MVKLYFVNHLRQVLKSDGELLNTKEACADHEKYNEMDSARMRAEQFVTEYPLMSCIICDDETEEIISASESDYKKAKILEKKLIEDKLQSKDNLKRIKWLVIVIVSSIFLIGILSYQFIQENSFTQLVVLFVVGLPIIVIMLIAFFYTKPDNLSNSEYRFSIKGREEWDVRNDEITKSERK